MKILIVMTFFIPLWFIVFALSIFFRFHADIVLYVGLIVFSIDSLWVLRNMNKNL